MIDKKALREVGKIKGIENLGYAELDYFQDIILFLIYKNISRELVFKGGTALFKFYNLDRFSKDLDFTANEEFNYEKTMRGVKKGLERYGAPSELDKKEGEKSLRFRFKIEGPLFTGVGRSLCSLKVDINLFEKTLSSSLKRYFPKYPDVPAFDVVLMEENEIAAEKVRAILTRDRARDVYDLWFLIKKGIEVSKQMINEKLDYYKLTWNFEEFKGALEAKKQTWEKELPYLVGRLPNFSTVKERLLEYFKNL